MSTPLETVSLLMDEELAAVWNRPDIPGGVSPNRHRAVADAALAHAVAHGQLVPLHAVEKMVEKFYSPL